MITLHNRIKPIIHFCNFFGMGYGFYGRFWIINCIILLINLINIVYTYHNVYIYITANMSEMYDLSTIMSVIRIHFHFITPILMFILFNINNTAVINYIEAFDNLVPSIQDISLKPYLLHFVGWIATTLIMEILQIIIYYVRINFIFFDTGLFTQFVSSNIWIITPILLYMFLTSIIFHGIRNINNKITTINAWKTYRLQWKELHCIAICLTKSVFGEIIIIFIGFTIIDITFFCWTLYLSWKNKQIIEMFGYTAIILVRAGLIFQLFYTCQHCKQEVSIIIIEIIQYKNNLDIATTNQHALSFLSWLMINNKNISHFMES